MKNTYIDGRLFLLFAFKNIHIDFYVNFQCVVSLPKYILQSAQVAKFFKPTESDIENSVKP